jgi:phenylalanyl-tRNA synthetase beta chain
VANIFVRIGLDPYQLSVTHSQDDIYAATLRYKGRDGKVLATVGIVAKRILKMFDIDTDVYYANLAWNDIMHAARTAKVSYKEVPRYPAVKRDLALLIDKSVQFAEIEKVAYETERKLLKAVTLFDVYEGKSLEAGKKSYAVSFVLQDETQTLNEKSIEKIMSKLANNLSAKLGAKLR